MTSPKNFCHGAQIIWQIWSCDQSLVTLAFLWKKLKFGNSSISLREVITTSILKGFDQKNRFFQRWSWFKFNNLGLALGMALKFNTSVAKGSKVKVRKFWRPIPMFVEVTGKKLAGEAFCPPPPTWIGLRDLKTRASRHLFFQNQPCKHQNNVWTLFKANNKDNKMTSFWCFYL